MSRMLLILCVAFSMGACNEFTRGVLNASTEITHEYSDSETWGRVVKRDFHAENFEHLNVTGTVRVIITHKKHFNVQIFGNEKCIEAYEVKVINGVLMAQLKNKELEEDPETPRITLYVSAPNLKSIHLNGASVLAMRGYKNEEVKLEVNVNGTSEIQMDSLKMRDLNVMVAGAANMSLKQVECHENMYLQLNGAGNVDVNVLCKALTLKMNGAGNLSGCVKGEKLFFDMNGAANTELNVDCQEIELEAENANIQLKGSCDVLRKNTENLFKLDVTELEVGGSETN